MVYFGKNGVQGRERPVLHGGPYLPPGHGHTLKFGVGFVRRRKKGVFDNLSGNSTLLCVLLDAALSDAHIALNGPGNSGGVLQNGV